MVEVWGSGSLKDTFWETKINKIYSTPLIPVKLEILKEYTLEINSFVDFSNMVSVFCLFCA